jgi:hypothetical protein
MSAAFANNASANRTFGQLMVPQDASDYISYKRAKVLIEKQQGLTPIQHYAYPYSFELVNKTSLNVNLYTQLNLQEVVVLQHNGPPSFAPTTLDPDAVFTTTYFMDPQGQLFGQTNCGYNHFTKYMQFT